MNIPKHIVTAFKYPRLVLSDPEGRVFDHPSLKIAGRSGNRIVLPPPSELVPLPRGSQLFSLPGRIPVGWDEKSRTFCPSEKLRVSGREKECTAVAAFLPPGYLRTLTPATRLRAEPRHLPLWAYCAVGWKERKFWATGILVDPDPHWNPRYFKDDRVLTQKVGAALEKNRENRLLRQLSRCALDYHCFAAKNVFYGRWECPLPTSPSCNADCLGCISLQSSECCPASQERIAFVPRVEEIVEIALAHLKRAEDPIVSFGQGCEGEPLIQWRLLERSIRELRERTDRGTINLNTNGSYPERVKRLCKAGLDSIRVTLNSANPVHFRRYHRPKGFGLEDVLESIIVGRTMGIYTSVNLLVHPGFTDREDEIERLLKLIRMTGLHLIQMRNLNIDPDLYLGEMGGGEGVGISRMMEILKEEFPSIQFGYFNRTKEAFYASKGSESIGRAVK